ncbi:MAG: hypothetical protein KBC48_00475 [Candidatus Pacebacteria bacterium]|nr:hypothetical protein [Candidatus Paceibacterota bacterium]
MARSRVVEPRSITDAWDQSLFQQAVKKVKTKQQVLTQAASEVVMKAQSSPLLPVTNNLKLLAPLAGVFTALLLTTGWQVAASGWQLPLINKGYEQLGAVGQMSFSQIPVVATSVLGAVSATGDNVSTTFKFSLTSLQSGVKQLLVNLQAAGNSLWTVINRIVVTISDFLDRSMDEFYVNLLSGIGFMSDRIEVVVDGWLTPMSLEARQSVREVASVATVMNEGWIVARENLAWGFEQLIKWGQGVVNNWNSFWSGLMSKFNRPKMPAILPLGSDNETQKDIKEIKQDVKSVLRLLNRQPVSSNGSSGLIVAPSTGSLSGDAALKADIASRFSDPVEVKVDGSGKAGVITPVFTTSGEGDYLFLLTPIKQ